HPAAARRLDRARRLGHLHHPVARRRDSPPFPGARHTRLALALERLLVALLEREDLAEGKLVDHAFLEHDHAELLAHPPTFAGRFRQLLEGDELVFHRDTAEQSGFLVRLHPRDDGTGTWALPAPWPRGPSTADRPPMLGYPRA